MNSRNYVRLKDAILDFWNNGCGFDINPETAFTDDACGKISIWYGNAYIDEILHERNLEGIDYAPPSRSDGPDWYMGDLEAIVYYDERKIVKRVDFGCLEDVVCFDTDEELISHIWNLEEYEIYEVWSDDFLKKFIERLCRDAR